MISVADHPLLRPCLLTCTPGDGILVLDMPKSSSEPIAEPARPHLAEALGPTSSDAAGILSALLEIRASFVLLNVTRARSDSDGSGHVYFRVHPQDGVSRVTGNSHSTTLHELLQSLATSLIPCTIRTRGSSLTRNSEALDLITNLQRFRRNALRHGTHCCDTGKALHKASASFGLGGDWPPPRHVFFAYHLIVLDAGLIARQPERSAHLRLHPQE